MAEAASPPPPGGGATGPSKPVILVTGAAGAVGRTVIRALGRRYTMVGLDRFESEEAHDSIVFDLSKDESVEAAIAEVRARHGDRIASVIHLAAYFDFTGEQHPLYEAVNVEGTRRLLRALRSLTVEQFVYSGTMLVHAPCAPGERIDETAPIAPRWAYPKSKAEAEAVIRAERGDIPVVLLHLAGLYDDRTAVPTLAHQIARIYERDLKSHFYAGDLRVGQSLVHTEDMVDAFRRAVARRAELPAETVLLIGEEEAPGYGELQDRLGRLIHGDEAWSTLVLPKPVAKAGAWAEERLEPVIPDAIDQGEKPFIRPFMIDIADDHYALDITAARTLLGWEPRHSIEETLPGIVAALKADPEGWYEANGITPPPWLETVFEASDDPHGLRTRHEAEYRAEHRRNLWAPFLSIGLGAWLVVAPFSLGYGGTVLAWSDILSGFAVILLSLLSLSWRLSLARWGAALVGVWLLMAPLIFWAPDAAAYLNATLVGALVIGFSAVVRPSQSESAAAALTGPAIPPGWDASPSSWLQRLPIIALAFVGLFVSVHLAAFQLGYSDRVWDPFFTGDGTAMNGTAQVVTSDISRALPVSDAGLGAVVYLLEILLGLMGGTRRWRTMPWVVASFGLLIVPLGIVSITFIIIQPILIGTWCALCLLAAAAMLLQIAYSANELVATAQFLRRRKRAGRPLLLIFFTGDTDDGPTRAPEDDFDRPARALLDRAVNEGVTMPWTLALTALVGLWLMFTRTTLGSDGLLADSDHLIGSLVVVVSVVAWAEVARAVRYANLGLGAALAAATLMLAADPVAIANGLVCGLILMTASLRRGPVRARYGSWDRAIV